MKLEYKILWLDDKIKDFIEDGFIEEVEQHLMENNFIPNITPVSKTKDFFNELDSSFDLILTDYHLNNDENGEKVIKKLRDSSVMTEVLFYTAKADLTDAKKIDRVSFLETGRKVGNEHIENVISKTIDLIDLTIKKFQHIVAMRGMIMHETSFLDTLMIKIIKKALKSKEIDFSDLSTSIYKQLITLFIKKKEFVEECQKKGNFCKLTKDNFVFSAKYKILTLSKVLESLGMDDFSEKYDKEVNSIRNKFAHAELQKDESGREFFKYKEEGIDFDDELCKKIRKDVITYKSRLDDLITIFGTQTRN